MPDHFIRPDTPHSSRIDVMDLHVAARLKQRRLRLELEPQLLDVAIGEQSGTIERVERGDKRLAASQLYNLAVVLGVGVAYFFADDVDGADQDDRTVAELPATDHKALSEAKRFARALARIPSPQIRHMIGDLLKSLVAAKDLPAIAPPPCDKAGEHPDPAEAVSETVAPKGSSTCQHTPCEPVSCEPAPCERAIESGSPKHWLARDMTRPEHKRTP